jgi:hypothetical protein
MKVMDQPSLLEPLIDELDLADLLRCRPLDLRRLRQQRQGPPFVMVGKVAMYRRCDVATWLDRETDASVDAPPVPITEEAAPGPDSIRSSLNLGPVVTSGKAQRERAAMRAAATTTHPETKDAANTARGRTGSTPAALIASRTGGATQ